jgi:hypothetical protein
MDRDQQTGTIDSRLHGSWGKKLGGNCVEMDWTVEGKYKHHPSAEGTQSRWRRRPVFERKPGKKMDCATLKQRAAKLCRFMLRKEQIYLHFTC